MDLDLPSLETFVRLADCGSFSETARCLDISQPAVSQRVARLESVIGLRLFVRGQDGVKPTREGAQLLDIARDIVRKHGELCVRMDHYVREGRGVIRAWIDRSVAGDALVRRILRHESLAGGLEIVRSGDETTDWKNALREYHVDFVITGSFLHAGELSGFHRFNLETQGGATIAWNPVYFDFHPTELTFPEALRSTLLIPSESLVSGFAGFLERWCLDTYRVLPPDLRTFEDEAAAREACQSGLGVLVFPGAADLRMDLGSTGLGVIRPFRFLLPDAYHYSLHLRGNERNQAVLQAALKTSELYSKCGVA